MAPPLPPLIEVLPKEYWLPRISPAARATAVELDSKPSGKKLLAQFRALKTDADIFRWALELQCIPHRPYGTYVWAFLVELKDYDAQTAVDTANKLIRLGIAISPSCGSFQSLEHIDPKEKVPEHPDPSIEKVPWGNFIDMFTDAKYDVSYRYVKGRSSTVLQLTYRDNFRLDLDIFTICDTEDPANVQASAHATLGPGQRIMPLRFGPLTTPRLYRAKWNVALKKMMADVEDYELFVSIGLAGVMSNLPIGMPGKAPTPEPTRSPRPVPPSQPEASRMTGPENQGANRPKPGAVTVPVDPATVKPGANDNIKVPPPPKPPVKIRQSMPANINRPTGPGYGAADGEVLGDIPANQMPTGTPGSTPYGTAMERPIAIVLHERFPSTRFRFNTGQGNTGPDVVWVDGEDPGFEIGDFKPDTDSGYAKFRAQVRRIWNGGPKAQPGKPFRAAMIAYKTDGTVYVGTVLKVTPSSGTPTGTPTVTP